MRDDLREYRQNVRRAHERRRIVIETFCDFLGALGLLACVWLGMFAAAIFGV